jgi:hypothetical protein
MPGVGRLRIYLEQAPKRGFAGALEWPGLDRSGRDEASARAALVAAIPRYRSALGAAAKGVPAGMTVDDLEVVERRTGGAGTDFGIPSIGPRADDEPMDARELRRLSRLLEAAWAAFDAAAKAAAGVELRKGPRGGGRTASKIRDHILEAERAYLFQIGGKVERDVQDDITVIRTAALAALGARARNEPFEMGRRRAPLWAPRYFVRRSAWHSLDHAWEIEDRSGPPLE